MEIILLDQSMSGYLRRYLVQTATDYVDFSVYSGDLKPKLQELCGTLLHELRSFKLHVRVKVRFEKLLDPQTICEAFFSNKQSTVLQGTDLTHEITDIMNAINNNIEEFCENGSDWNITDIERTDIHVARYQPIAASASTYMELPVPIAKKRAIVNVCNDDEECFKWAILSALHPAPHNPNRPNNYRRFIGRYRFQDYTYPFNIHDIPRFEEQHQLSIFVYLYESVVYPLYRPKVLNRRTIHLLLLYNENTNKNHYCWIKNLNMLLHSRRKHGGRSYFCHLCLFSFTTQARVDAHIVNCKSDNCTIVMPAENQKTLKFQAISKMLRQPCVFYADFESILEPCDTSLPNQHQSFSVETAHHTPCGFGLFQVVQCCNNSQPIYPRCVKVERNQNAVSRFLQYLLRRATEYQLDFIENRQPMPVLTGSEWKRFYQSPNCIICENRITATCENCVHVLNRRNWCDHCKEQKISRDHCHIRRAFRGPAHAQCNISYKLSNDVCVFIHNLKRYDSHLIMQQIATFANQHQLTIECIPKAMDSYVMFALKMNAVTDRSQTWKIKFLDSFQFLSCSLEKLVTNLRASGDSSFLAMKSNFHDPTEFQLLLRKGVYPYEHMSHWDKFKENTLPPMQAFYSSLTDSNITPADYTHAQKVWETFNIQNMGEYHDLYLATDTLLLCDVIENFRTLCLQNDKLDPAHYVTLPSFGWDAVLRRSPVELELLTDPDMYTFLKTGIRGGVSSVTMRYAEANNPLLSHYTTTRPTSYIASFDANNLYGYGMSQVLPTSNFIWMTQEELDRVDVLQIADDSEYGCILDVDLQYPAHLHDAHNCYPLAPEHILVTDDMLSPYSSNLKQKINIGSSTQRKLVPNLQNKTSYVVHYRNLKVYVQLGMIVVRKNRGIKFRQNAWMKPYIVFNTEQRKKAKSDIEKDLFKLLNNSVFGKSMENVRAYTNVELVTTPDRMRRLVSNPRFTRFEVFDNDLVAVMLRKKTLTLKKPIYTGFTVLELSKELMYQFHYNFMKPTFPNTTLLFTDTDSLTYYIQTENLYKELATHTEHFDFSDYAPNHFLFNVLNKKVMGKMKDETNGVPIEEFVGLRSKMYSIKCDHHSKKRAKGVAGTIVKKQIVHEDYTNTLAYGRAVRHSCQQIKNKGHHVFTMTTNKISLSAYDDKRFILNNGIQTLAFGHYQIRHYENVLSDDDDIDEIND